MCGGTFSWSWQSLPSDGLSPRVRGNRSRPVSRSRQRRSIPACAGEPRRVAAAGVSPKVYPRVCGGTAANGPPPLHARGLSPRVRGNHHPQRADGGGQGSIPACAGEPGRHRSVTGRGRVYPRVCGGTPATRPAALVAPGLSPRVRGNLDQRSPATGRRRSIPACAGEPQFRRLRLRLPRVYPRVCGGTQSGPNPCNPAQGLSPRVRGNPPGAGLGRRHLGSIPACAGEPPPPRYRLQCRQVYPRVCGGTQSGPNPCNPAQGLSPRVRGNLKIGLAHRFRVRSIPACAGEPASCPVLAPGHRVYPRVCGGTPAALAGGPNPCGLSPRVRGNPLPPLRRLCG